jgi:uncharacterized protein (TIGR02246 family)
MTRVATFFFFLLLLAPKHICAQTPLVGDTAGVNALYRDWGAAVGARGAEGYASFFVDDAVLLPPGAPPVVGRVAIRAWMQSQLETYVSQTTSFRPEEMRIDEEWAFVRVTIAGRRTPRAGGEAVEVENKYLDVLQKQADRAWRFVYRAWNATK